MNTNSRIRFVINKQHGHEVTVVADPVVGLQRAIAEVVSGGSVLIVLATTAISTR